MKEETKHLTLSNPIVKYLITVDDSVMRRCPTCAEKQPVFVLVSENGVLMACCRCQNTIYRLTLMSKTVEFDIEDVH